MSVCPNCGQENPAGATLCGTCSYPLDTSDPQSAGEHPPPPEFQMPPGIQAPPGYPEYRPFQEYPPPPPAYPPPPGGVPYGVRVVVPFPEQLTPGQKTGQFFIGLGIGLIPLVLALLALGSSLVNINISQVAGLVFYLALGLFLAAFVLAIVFLAQPTRRFIGYGMLTSVLASPVIFFYSCVAIVSATFRYHR